MGFVDALEHLVCMSDAKVLPVTARRNTTCVRGTFFFQFQKIFPIFDEEEHFFSVSKSSRFFLHMPNPQGS